MGRIRGREGLGKEGRRGWGRREGCVCGWMGVGVAKREKNR